MITGEKIIFFGGSDWWYHPPRSGIRLLKEFIAAGNEAIYINSIPLRMPSPGKSGSGRRYLNKLKSLTRYFKKAEEGIHVLTPITIPGLDKPWMQELNKKLLRSQIKYAMRMAGWSEDALPVVIAATPAAGLILPGFERKCAIYHLSDKYDKFRDLKDGNRITQLDEVVVNEADALVCVSRAIAEAYQARSPNCHYVSHGVNFELFNKAATEAIPIPKDIEGITGTIIGYFGSITESNDKKILEHLAATHPEWNIVLIGQVVSDYSELRAYSNIHFLGAKPLESLPAYGQRFNVCIMNWVMNDWIRFCSPLKAKEYLAMGKPVVSVPIPEVVESYADVVAIAETPEAFTREVELAIANDNSERRQARIECVRYETWADKAELVSVMIESCMGRR